MGSPHSSPQNSPASPPLRSPATHQFPARSTSPPTSDTPAAPVPSSLPLLLRPARAPAPTCTQTAPDLPPAPASARPAAPNPLRANYPISSRVSETSRNAGTPHSFPRCISASRQSTPALPHAPNPPAPHVPAISDGSSSRSAALLACAASKSHPSTPVRPALFELSAGNLKQ